MAQWAVRGRLAKELALQMGYAIHTADVSVCQRQTPITVGDVGSSQSSDIAHLIVLEVVTQGSQHLLHQCC